MMAFLLAAWRTGGIAKFAEIAGVLGIVFLAGMAASRGWISQETVAWLGGPETLAVIGTDPQAIKLHLDEMRKNINYHASALNTSDPEQVDRGCR